MKDPNKAPNPFRVSKPKRSEAIGKFLWFGGGPTPQKKTQPKPKPNAQKPPLHPVRFAHPQKPRLPTPSVKKTIKPAINKELRELNRRQEPFIQDKGTWNSVLPKESKSPVW